MKTSAMLVFVLVLVCSWIPQGLSAEDDKMGDAATQTEICNLPPEQGMCLAYIPQYFYNSTSQSCETFIYGGCQGNGNRFRSKAKCMETCQAAKFNVLRVEPDSLPDSLTYSLPDASPVPCDHTRKRTHSNACNQPAESGPCYGYIPQFFYNSTSGKCETFIYGGCGGNQNRFDSLTSCQMYCRAVPSFNATEVCKLLPETGPCRAYKPQFFYNDETKRCEIFIYGGCAGNQNRFDSLKTCLQKCNPEGSDEITPIISPDSTFKSDEICYLQPDIGPCLADIPRYFYNCTSEQCEQFQYGGCQGNKNNFDSERGCLLHCGQNGVDMATFSKPPAKSLDVCSLPPETGFCKARFPRYYFNSASKSCELFIYGGCKGNPNNFVDEKACMENCKKED